MKWEYDHEQWMSSYGYERGSDIWGLLLGCDAVYLCGRIPWRRRQHGPPKFSRPTTTLHGVTIRKASTWIKGEGRGLFQSQSQNSPEESGENLSVKTDSNPTEIQTGNLLNTSLQCYFYMDLLNKIWHGQYAVQIVPLQPWHSARLTRLTRQLEEQEMESDPLMPAHLGTHLERQKNNIKLVNSISVSIVTWLHAERQGFDSRQGEEKEVFSPALLCPH